MKFEVVLTKRSLFLSTFFFIVAGAIFVLGVTPNPGHDASSVGPGIFSGSSQDNWVIPGKLGIRTTPSQSSLQVSTPNYIWIETDDSLGAGASEAPGIVMSQTSSNKRWLIAKRGSSYAGAGSPGDSLFFGYFDGTSWQSNPALYLSPSGSVNIPSNLCLNNNCRSNWPEDIASGSVTITSNNQDVSIPLSFTPTKVLVYPSLGPRPTVCPNRIDADAKLFEGNSKLGTVQYYTWQKIDFASSSLSVCGSGSRLKVTLNTNSLVFNREYTLSAGQEETVQYVAFS